MTPSVPYALKVTGGGRVNRHRHSGGQVLGYVLQGSWRYLERDWVARPGTFVYEPPGDIHTLVVDDAEEMQTLFLLEGVVQYLDDADQVIAQDDVFTKLERYLAFCRREGIEPAHDRRPVRDVLRRVGRFGGRPRAAARFVHRESVLR